MVDHTQFKSTVMIYTGLCLEMSVVPKRSSQAIVRGLQGSCHPPVSGHNSLLVLTFKALNDLEKEYMKDSLLPFYTAYQLRSASEVQLSVVLPSEVMWVMIRDEAFSMAASHLWSDLLLRHI